MIISVGINHRTSPLEIREKLSFTSEQLKENLPRLEGPSLQGGVVLSTCNRTEIYALCHNEEAGKDRLCRFLSQVKDLPQWFIQNHVECRTEEKAIRHLFRVASGIDSMVLGEDQILHQVRKALETTQSTIKCPSALGHLFHCALKAGKRARNDTQIGRFCLSISHASVEMALQVLSDFSRKSALVLGAGDTGRLTAKILKDHGIGDLFISNRSWERAQELADLIGGRAVPFENLRDGLSETDLVISSTDSPSFIIQEKDVTEAIKKRNGRPLLLIDIAIPRDIDPKVKKVAGVTLFNIDDLQVICNNSLEERKKEALKVEEIVEEEVQEFLDWWQLQEVVPTIAAMVKKAEAIRQKELARTLAKLNGISPYEKERMEAMTRAILSKLLHSPIQFTKKHRKEKKTLKAIEEFFDITTEDEK